MFKYIGDAILNMEYICNIFEFHNLLHIVFPFSFYPQPTFDWFIDLSVFAHVSAREWEIVYFLKWPYY